MRGAVEASLPPEKLPLSPAAPPQRGPERLPAAWGRGGVEALPEVPQGERAGAEGVLKR